MNITECTHVHPKGRAAAQNGYLAYWRDVAGMSYTRPVLMRQSYSFTAHVLYKLKGSTLQSWLKSSVVCSKWALKSFRAIFWCYHVSHVIPVFAFVWLEIRCSHLHHHRYVNGVQCHHVNLQTHFLGPWWTYGTTQVHGICHWQKCLLCVHDCYVKTWVPYFSENYCLWMKNYKLVLISYEIAVLFCE